jgi:hypothetical protein
MSIIITATRGAASKAVVEIEGPLPSDPSKYGDAWWRSVYRIAGIGHPRRIAQNLPSALMKTPRLR